MGFTLPPPLPAERCALTAPFHPYRPFGRAEGKAVCFLWHFPSRCRDRALPGMPPVRSSDFPPRLLGAIAWPARAGANPNMKGGLPLDGLAGALGVSSHAHGGRRQDRLLSSSKYRIHSSISTLVGSADDCSAPAVPKRFQNRSGERQRAPASRARSARPRSPVTTTASRDARERWISARMASSALREPA